MARRGREEVSIISVLETYQTKLRNAYLTARRALVEHVRRGAPLDNVITAIDGLESIFDRLTMSITLPSQGAPSRHLDVVLKRQEDVYNKFVELRRLLEERRFNEALRKLNETYEAMRLALRLTMLVYAGWRPTLLRIAYPEVVEYIPAEEVAVADPLARRIYSVLLERGEMSSSELAEAFREYSPERINRALEELEARGLLRVFLRGGETYFRVVA